MTPIRRVAQAARRVAGCPRRALGRLRKDGRGQSLSEFALILPVILIILLGLVNIGLAVRAQIQLAQVVQQAAQYLVHHPQYADADTPITTPPTYSKLVGYMNSLSSYQLTPLEVHLTVGTSPVEAPSLCITDPTCVQQDTVTVTYGFPLVIPMIGKLSVGLLSNGVIHLGATASTVAASHPVGNPTVCVFGGKKAGCDDLSATGSNKAKTNETEIEWDAPIEAMTSGSPEAIGLPLSYCIVRHTLKTGTGQYTLDTYYAPTGAGSNGVPASQTAVNTLNCIPGEPSSNKTTATKRLYFIDPVTTYDRNTFPRTVFYDIYTIQANGIMSPFVSVAP